MEEELREELRDCNLALDRVIEKLENAYKEIERHNRQMNSIRFTMMICFIILFILLVGIIIIFTFSTKRILCDSLIL